MKEVASEMKVEEGIKATKYHIQTTYTVQYTCKSIVHSYISRQQTPKHVILHLYLRTLGRKNHTFHEFIKFFQPWNQIHSSNFTDIVAVSVLLIIQSDDATLSSGNAAPPPPYTWLLHTFLLFNASGCCLRLLASGGASLKVRVSKRECVHVLYSALLFPSDAADPAFAFFSWLVSDQGRRSE